MSTTNTITTTTATITTITRQSRAIPFSITASHENIQTPAKTIKTATSSQQELSKRKRSRKAAIAAPTPAPHSCSPCHPLVSTTTTPDPGLISAPAAAKTGKRFRKVAARCRAAGCRSRPWFGLSGTKTPKACKLHKADGEVNVYSPTCEQDDCNTRPTYGVDQGCARFCRLHKVGVFIVKGGGGRGGSEVPVASVFSRCSLIAVRVRVST